MKDQVEDHPLAEVEALVEQEALVVQVEELLQQEIEGDC